MLLKLCFLHYGNAQIYNMFGKCVFLHRHNIHIPPTFILSFLQTQSLGALQQWATSFLASGLPRNLWNTLNSTITSEHSMVFISQASKRHYNPPKQQSGLS